MELILKDIESKTKQVGTQFVCDWFGKKSLTGFITENKQDKTQECLALERSAD